MTIAVDLGRKATKQTNKSTKTYVVGTQKNRLNETVLLNTQNHMLQLMVKKILIFFRTFLIFVYLDLCIAL